MVTSLLPGPSFSHYEPSPRESAGIRTDMVPVVTELTVWQSLMSCAPARPGTPAFPHTTAIPQTPATSFFSPYGVSSPVRVSSKSSPSSGVPPFSPQTRLSTFSVPAAGTPESRCRAAPAPRARGQQGRPMQMGNYTNLSLVTGREVPASPQKPSLTM